MLSYTFRRSEHSKTDLFFVNTFFEYIKNLCLDIPVIECRIVNNVWIRRAG